MGLFRNVKSNARAVVMGSYDDTSAGDRPIRTRVTVRLRPRLQDGGLGEEQTLKVWVSWKVAALLEPGLDIPVELDQASGQVTGIGAKELNNELSPRFGEAGKRQPAWTNDFDLDGITQVPALMARITSAAPLAAQWGWDLDRAQQELRGPAAPA